MENYPIEVSLLWNKVDVPCKLKIDITYNSEVVGNAMEKIKALWRREFIGLLKDSPFDFEVETPLPTGLDDADVLMYGGEKLSFSIDNQEAMLPLIEDYLRESYAERIFKARFEEIADEFHALTVNSCICVGGLLVRKCSSCEQHCQESKEDAPGGDQ